RVNVGTNYARRASYLPAAAAMACLMWLAPHFVPPNIANSSAKSVDESLFPGLTAPRLAPVPSVLGRSSHRNEHTQREANGLFMPAAERIAVGWLYKPSKLLFRSLPEHKVHGDHTSYFTVTAPPWADTGLELYGWRQSEGLSENEFASPIRP